MASDVPDNFIREVLDGIFHNFRDYIARNKITDLDFSGKIMNHENTSNIGLALLTSDVTKVNLSKNQINDANAIALAEAFTCTKVTTVDLSDNHLSAKGAIGFAQKVKYSKDTTITELDLTNNQIGTRSIKNVQEQLESARITRVKLVPQKAPEKIKPAKVKPAARAYLPLSQARQGIKRMIASSEDHNIIAPQNSSTLKKNTP